MGSFDFTCAISHLPIRCGDEVRFCLLQSSPFDRWGHYASKAAEIWYLRAPPIRAEYNDYGSIEKIHPEDEYLCQVWLDGLKLDLMEKGVGDNTYHDVATRKKMSFDELLEALWERRVEVIGELPEPDQKIYDRFSKNKLAKGVPSLSRIEKVIKKAGKIKITIADDVLTSYGGTKICVTPELRKTLSSRLGVFVEGDGNWFLDMSQLGTNYSHFIVDQLAWGEMRVRLGGYGGYGGYEETLIYLNALAKKLNRKYAAVVTCGSGSYADCAEINIRPKPGTLDNEGRTYVRIGYEKRDKDKPKYLQVRACMVREDVWQALLSLSLKDWGGESKISDYYEHAVDLWVKYREFKKEVSDQKDDLLSSLTKFTWRSKIRDGRNPVGFFISENPSINGFGLDVMWNLFFEQDRSKEQIDNFCNNLAQATYISKLLSWLRMSWEPVDITSPQFGEWEMHREFHQALSKCSDTAIARLNKEFERE